jgi:hypothetical protein
MSRSARSLEHPSRRNLENPYHWRSSEAASHRQLKDDGKRRARDSREERLSGSQSKDRAGDDKKPTVRRVQLSNSSEATLAIVRPRTRRTTSSSSSSRSESRSTPPPAYSGPASPRSPLPSATTFALPSATTSAPPIPEKIPLTPVERACTRPEERRRQDKYTPSVYTFASDSTKLGEIPMQRWNVPYDYEAMARRNQEVPLRPWTSEDPPQKSKRGFFGLFKKSGGVVVG